MNSKKSLFLSHVGQTSKYPLLFEIQRAEGVFQYDLSGKKYFDLNSGIAVSSLGHCHPEVVKAVCAQANTFMHTMVYGEHVQSPQVDFASLLLKEIDDHFESVYYLMSGTEATELAMKMAKRFTGRYEIIACKNAYHGSTQGAESLRSDEEYKGAYRPLLPGIRHIEFNNEDDIGMISNSTAAVICEVVQGEAGVVKGNIQFLEALAERCAKVGALLIVDEIQTGFGRTGSLFAHQQYKIVPDILLIGKAMGGGMPIAGVVSSKEIMECLTQNPDLGHITTFGGHPVSVAAAHAALKVLLNSGMIKQVNEKAQYLAGKLEKHPIVKQVRYAGLLMALEPTKRKYLKHIAQRAFELGVLMDWFLFNDRSLRLAPPLIITMSELEEAADLLLKALDYAMEVYS